MKLFSFEWVSQLSVKSELFKEKLTLFAYLKKILQFTIENVETRNWKKYKCYLYSAKMHMNLWREVDNLEIQFRIQITFV